MGNYNKYLSPEKKEQIDKIKYEIAKELGISSKVDQGGWESLTTKEAGMIGGILVKKMIERTEGKEPTNMS